MDKMIRALREILNSSDNIVFFGGAGVSTESGIPDFRGAGGLYHADAEYPPEMILSHTFLIGHPDVFFRFYREKMIFPEARPNQAHIRLAGLESAGRLRAVITQNIDGLHQMAGSRNVLELHGSVHRNTCAACSRTYPLELILRGSGIPSCPACGGMVRPDVVLYEEHLDERVMAAAAAYLTEADTLIVGGTSLSVYPAAGLVRFYKGSRLVLINRSPTPFDDRADLLINGSLGTVLQAVCASPHGE